MTSKGRARSREYDYRPNLNTSQFSQGTLFSGGERTPPMHRGYTPARMQEVRQSGHFYAAGAYPQRLGLEAQLRDNVARSTVPTSLIKHPLQISATDAFDVRHEGVYKRVEGGTRGAAKVRPTAVRSPTLIHELGHHASAEAKTTSSEYDTDAKRGQEEAYADDYAAEHYRDRRGRQQPVGDYAGGRTASTRGDGRSVVFWNAYEKHRQTGAGAERRDYRRKLNTTPESVLRGEQINGQQPLLHKVTTSTATGTSAPDWDYALGERRKDR